MGLGFGGLGLGLGLREADRHKLVQIADPHGSILQLIRHGALVRVRVRIRIRVRIRVRVRATVWA